MRETLFIRPGCPADYRFQLEEKTPEDTAEPTGVAPSTPEKVCSPLAPASLGGDGASREAAPLQADISQSSRLKAGMDSETLQWRTS